VILGGDSLLHERALVPSHWEVRPFVVGELDRFFADIDFYVYYTNPAWRESFGRAVAEAIVAGKVVITDPGTAEVFGSAVVAADADEVDAVIGRFLSDPGSYAAFVRAAQREIRRFRPDAFRAMALRAIGASRAPRHALV
jgi:glycosyltransferase involved in cell wall biosynthesis